MINVIQEDLITISMMMGCLAVLEVLNIVLGSVMAGVSHDWSWKKFLYGFIKALLVVLVMLTYCVVLDVLPFILERVEILIPEDLITVIQVVGIVFVAITKYVKDIYDKLTTILNG